MLNNFQNCFAITNAYEGWHQFSNDPYDPGGATYSGVTQHVYDAYRLSKKLYIQSVKNMTDAECAEIYKFQYWDKIMGDSLFAGLDLFGYDVAVNSGPSTAIKFIQEDLQQHVDKSIAVDGVLGFHTLGALAKVNDRAGMIQRLCDRRMSFWHSLKTWWRFGKGWTARGDGIDIKALRMLAAAK